MIVLGHLTIRRRNLGEHSGQSVNVSVQPGADPEFQRSIQHFRRKGALRCRCVTASPDEQKQTFKSWQRASRQLIVPTNVPFSGELMAGRLLACPM